MKRLRLVIFAVVAHWLLQQTGPLFEPVREAPFRISAVERPHGDPPATNAPALDQSGERLKAPLQPTIGEIQNQRRQPPPITAAALEPPGRSAKPERRYCREFSTREEAAAYCLTAYGATVGCGGMDGDGDGVPCESLPTGRSATGPQALLVAARADGASRRSRPRYCRDFGTYQQAVDYCMERYGALLWCGGMDRDRDERPCECLPGGRQTDSRACRRQRERWEEQRRRVAAEE